VGPSFDPVISDVDRVGGSGDASHLSEGDAGRAEESALGFAIPAKCVPPGPGPGFGARADGVSLCGSDSFILASALASAEVRLAFPGSISRPRRHEAAAS